MIRVQVSSKQVTDNLFFVKGVDGEMCKCTPKQTFNIGTIPKTKWEKFRKERDLLRTSGCYQVHRQKGKSLS